MNQWNWRVACAYQPDFKVQYHFRAMRRLRALARHLGMAPGTFELVSRPGEISSSGEIILCDSRVRIRVSQDLGSLDHGICIQRCRGYSDNVGRAAYFAPIDALNNLGALTRHVRSVLGG